MLTVAGPWLNKRLIQKLSRLRVLAGVAEVVKGAGLKIRSRMGSWVRIPPPALTNQLPLTVSEFTGIRIILIVQRY